MEPHQHSFVTETEFLSLPETLDKVELIDGEIIVSPSPTFWHQEILRRIVYALGSWAAAQQGPVIVGQAPLDVRFRSGRILQPDAFILFQNIAPDHEGPIDAVPALCVEVLSSNRSHDRLTKRVVYGEAGVRAYWVIDPAGTVEQWTGSLLSVRDVPSDRLESELLPGFSLALHDLFAST